MPRFRTKPFPPRWGFLATATAAGLVLLAAAIMPVQTTPAQGVSGTEIQVDTDGISVVFSTRTSRDFLSLSARVVGPDGVVFEQRTEGATLHWIPNDDLTDGRYTWEAWAVTADPGAPFKALPADTSPEIGLEHFFAPEDKLTHVASGSLVVNHTRVENVFTSSLSENGSNSALVVEAAGVGIGTAAPARALHVRRTNNTAEIMVEETGASSVQEMFSLVHNGHPKFRMTDTSQSSVSWEFRTAGVQGSNERFQINKIGSGAIEMLVRAGGNVTIAGSLTQGSSRTIKERITELDPEQILARLDALPVHEWSYQRSPKERHLGPMAEDFHNVFGLGGSDKHIAPGDLAGVALAAAKGLAERSAELEEETSVLRAENAELRDRLERETTELRNRLEQLEATLLSSM